MKPKAEIEEGLAQFHGTDTWTRHRMFRQLLMTDGILYLRDAADCHWLVDAIGSHIFTARRRLNPQAQPFQHWHFKRASLNRVDKPHRLWCTDGNSEKAIVSQRIEYSDFPLDEISVYAVWDEGQDAFVLMLPGEY
jgi:hypothetical protein